VKGEGGNMRTLHKLLLQLSIVIFWDLWFLGRGCVLVVFSPKNANVLVMILRFLLQKKLHQLKSLAKGVMNGIGHALMLGSPIES